MSRMLGRPNAKESLLHKWQVELCEPCLQPLDGYMHCTLCNTLISANRRAQIVAHLNSAQHLGTDVKPHEKKKRKISMTTTTKAKSTPKATATATSTTTTEAEAAATTKEGTEGLTNANDENENDDKDKDKENALNDRAFDLDLCAAFKSAKIPLSALNNTQFRIFLHKYTNRPIRDEQFMRWRYNV